MTMGHYKQLKYSEYIYNATTPNLSTHSLSNHPDLLHLVKFTEDLKLDLGRMALDCRLNLFHGICIKEVLYLWKMISF